MTCHRHPPNSSATCQIGRQPAPTRPQAVAAALAAALLLAACGGAGERQTRESVQQRLAAGDHAAALVQLKALVRERPDAAYARALLGQTLLQTGDAPGAEVELQRALDGGHPVTEVVPALAQALLAQGKAAAVVERFGTTALPQPAAAANLAVTLARARQALGQSGAALRALQELPPAVGAEPGVVIMETRLLADLGRADEARQRAALLVERFPSNAEAWLLQGDALSSTDAAAAVAAYDKALALDARLAPAHAALVQQALAEGRIDLARERLQRMNKALPGVGQAQFLEALVNYSAGDFEKARAQLQPLLRAPASPAGVLRLAGLTERRLGAPEQAQSLLSRAAEQLPGHRGVQLELAEVRLQLGRADRAIELLEPLTRQPGVDAAVWTTLGQARSQLGQFKAADEAFARARALKPDDAALKAGIAQALLARGDGDRALRELQAAADGGAGAPATATLISTHMRQGNTAAALKAADQLVTQRPGVALPHLLRGHVLEARGERAAARQAYERALSIDPGYMAAVDSLAELDRRDGQPAAARGRYEAVLKRQPASASALLALASQARQDGAAPAAVREWLDRAVAAQPADPGVWSSALAVEQALGDPAARLARAQRAAAALPDVLSLQLALSESHLAVGERTQALEVLQRLAARQPRSVPVRLLVAEALQHGGDLKGARRQVNEALDLEPRSFAARRAHALLLMREGRSDVALSLARELREESRQGDQQIEALLLQADVLSLRDQRREAAAVLREALALRRDGAIARQLSAMLRAAGDRADAERFEAEWQRSAPADLEFLAHLAQDADARGDTAAAIAAYRRIVERVPDAALALNNLAVLLLDSRPDEALALAERANKLAGASPPLLDTLAQALLAKGQLDRALRTQQAALQIDPTAGDLRFTLARIHAAAGRKDEALRELRRLAERPAFPRRLQVEDLIRELGG